MNKPKLQDSTQNIPDFLFMPEKEENSIKHYKQTLALNIHHFYIVDEIGEVVEFLDLINTLKTAEQQDTIFIYLNTEGGFLKTAIQLISAMRQSAATVITSLEGEVCSAGTMIFLAGHKQIVNPNCTFMIHNYSAGIGGKGHEIASHATFRGEYAKKLMNDVYANFLTAEEIEEVLEGRDIWMSSDQVIARLESKNSLLSTEIDTTNLAEKLPEFLSEMFNPKTDKVLDNKSKKMENAPKGKPKAKPKAKPLKRK